jgi:hypothetical protein
MIDEREVKFFNPVAVATAFNRAATSFDLPHRARVEGESIVMSGGSVEQAAPLMWLALNNRPPTTPEMDRMDDLFGPYFMNTAHMKLVRRTEGTAPRTAEVSRPDTLARISAVKVKAIMGGHKDGKEVTLMKIVSLYGFEFTAPHDYFSDTQPWVIARWGEEEDSVYLELGQPVGEVTTVWVGDEFSKDVFAKLYRYIIQAGHRYGMLKKRDKSCHHSIERFEV